MSSSVVPERELRALTKSHQNLRLAVARARAAPAQHSRPGAAGAVWRRGDSEGSGAQLSDLVVVMGGPATREDVVDYVPSARATRGGSTRLNRRGWRPGARRPPRGDRPSSFRAKRSRQKRGGPRGSRAEQPMLTGLRATVKREQRNPGRDLSFVIWSSLTCRRKSLSVGAFAQCSVHQNVDGCIR